MPKSLGELKPPEAYPLSLLPINIFSLYAISYLRIPAVTLVPIREISPLLLSDALRRFVREMLFLSYLKKQKHSRTNQIRYTLRTLVSGAHPTNPFPYTVHSYRVAVTDCFRINDC